MGGIDHWYPLRSEQVENVYYYIISEGPASVVNPC